jgi:large subunit ribosomal protein L4
MMAASVQLRAADGAVRGSLRLDERVFGIQPNVPVLHQVVTAQLAAARAGTQSTKTRAEVSGGGRKPFKQKGTGRARQGSERAPHFTGGGVALGPKPRSYRQRTPRKMIQLALRSALSDRAADGKVVVIDSWPWETPSTKGARTAIDALGLDGRALVVLARTDEDAYKSFRNLPGIQLMLVTELNAYDILCNDWIVFTRETLPGETSEVDQDATAGSGGPGGPGTEGESPAVPPAPSGDLDNGDEPGPADVSEPPVAAGDEDAGPGDAGSVETGPGDTGPVESGAAEEDREVDDE